jgi:hypothetical protein
LASSFVVPLRKWLTRTVLGTLLLFTALVSVGLTAPAGSPFSIAIQPVFVRVDPASLAQSRARALGIDVDIKVGSMHLHLGWSALPISAVTTNAQPGLL